MVNWQNDRTIECPSGTTDTWSADLEFLPNPVGFYRAATIPDGDVSMIVHSIGLNTQLGDTFAAAYAGLISSYQRWRLAYYSATVYYDAPALADQGSVVASQFPLEGAMVGGPADFVSASNGGSFTRYQVGLFTAEDFPSFEKLLTMPNAYSGLAKDGVYMPLRLDSNHSNWHSERDSFIDGSGCVNEVFPDSGVISTGTASLGLLFPTLTALGAASGMVIGQPIPGLCSGISGQASFRNLSKTGRLRVVVRAGYECMASPGTSMTPFLQVSPPYDMLAVAAYYQISRELKDAYPADYNDLGKLWEVIKRVASVVSPFMPVPVRMIGSIVGSAVDGFRSRGQDEKSIQYTKSAPRDGPPAASMERIQKSNASRMGTVAKTAGKRKPRRS